MEHVEPLVHRLIPRTEAEGRYMEDVAIFAARRCRSVKNYGELWNEVAAYKPEKRRAFLHAVVNEEWAIDVLEMVYLAFDFQRVPLWAVLEMVRHRMLFRDFSLEQLSQRAIDPLRLHVQAPTPELQTLVDGYIADVSRAVAEDRMPPEQLREVIPQGVLVNFVMGANARAWHHFFFMRCSKEWGGKGGAHPKLETMANEALLLAHQACPTAFEVVIPA